MLLKTWLAKGVVVAVAVAVSGCGLTRKHQVTKLTSEIQSIQQAIRESGGNWTAGITSVSALTPELKLRRLGLIRDPSVQNSLVAKNIFGPSPSAPPAADWRSAGAVTPVKDQGNCGSCWAFASTAALESQIIIHQGVVPDLSEQTLISCSAAGSCDGGYPDKAANFFKLYGSPPESDFPYLAQNVSCSYGAPNWHDHTVRLVRRLDTPQSPAYLEHAIATYGPVIADFEVYDDFYSYAGGVYTHPPTPRFGHGHVGSHAVLVVGYDHDAQYFIVKNSWGTGWGEGGYFRIAYSQMDSQVNFGEDLYAFDDVTGAPTPAPPNPKLTVTLSSYDSNSNLTLNIGGQVTTSGNGVTYEGTPQPNADVYLGYGGMLGTDHVWSGDCASFGSQPYAQFKITQDMNCTFTVTNDGPPPPPPGATVHLRVAVNSYDPDGTVTVTGQTPAFFATATTPVNTDLPAGAQINLGYSGYLGNQSFWTGDCGSFGNAANISFNITNNMDCTFNVFNDQGPTPPPPPPPPPPPGPDPQPVPGAGYAGCFVDDASRALPSVLMDGGATVESCRAAAAAAGFEFAGLQFGGQCFAGNLGTLQNYPRVSDAECNMPCSANPAEACGNGWRNSVYSTGVSPNPGPGPDPGPPPPPPPPPPPAGGQAVSLQTANGNYVCAEGGGGGQSGNGGLVDANRGSAGSWETFTITGDLYDGATIGVISVDGSYFSAQGGGGGEVDANRGGMGAWETFRIIKVGGSGGSQIQNGDQVGFQTINGNFLCAEGGGGGDLNASRSGIGAWETFTIQFR